MRDRRVSWVQDLTWRAEAVAYDVFTFLMRLMPTDFASDVGGWLFRRFGPMTRTHVLAWQNLILAFPEKDEAWRQKVLGDQWESNGRTVFEFPQMDRILPSTGRVELVGRERMQAIRDGGKPVVFVSGHLSNWEVMPAAIVDSGVVCQMTYRAANNPYVDKRIRDSRARYGVRLFAPKGGDGARELLEGMKKGESVALMNDQKFNRGGVAAPFFGREVMAAPGPSRLALRFGTVLQPMSVQRLKGARFRAVVHEPIEVPDTGDKTADIAAGVAAVTKFVEDQVRERPGEWFWVHRRWPKAAYVELAEKGLGPPP
ncbi:lysophospholipid acyltransferase family protein [Caulobacter sp. NIBR1757]|uniref:lysophospholipid acyltransferase family protein n=1 Tax=Caulobacter sp. NIBR1757 TaxID=3016000 RepID=UPI0022F08F6E|nr:lysophospholipid acyltransferase family protein [Caulobacter sp. NIBR1757]WGM38436.1 Lipid A biosynthesis lauroyltransferase [Caulobacter sp. NIBR1757]